jgi:nucleoid-associated protein YgaU
MALMEKYRAALELTGKLPVDALSVSEEGGKLVIKGTAHYQLEKDLIWDAIKQGAGWENEVSADIKVRNQDAYGYYTVQAGDTLSKIAQRFLEKAGRYTEIFELNKDTLKNPDLIKPGQVLKLPWKNK